MREVAPNSWRRMGTYAALFLGAALALLLAEPPATAAGVPRVVCDDSVFDFGAITDTQTVSHTFTIRNAGSVPAAIHRVFACCGLDASLSSTNLPPGSNACLRVTLSPAGMRGTIEKPVDLITSDPRDRYCRVLVRGTVTPTIVVEPRVLSLGTRRAGEPAAAEVVVSAVDGALLRVTNVSASAGFTASYTEGTGGVFHVQVAAIPPPSNGWHRGAVCIFTDQTTHPLIHVPVHVNVASEWIVQPAEIVLTDASMRSTHLTRWVVISSRFGRGFSIGSIDKPDPDLDVTQQQLRSNIVRLAVSGIRAGPGIDGRCLAVGLKTEPPVELRIPFRMAP